MGWLLLYARFLFPSAYQGQPHDFPLSLKQLSTTHSHQCAHILRTLWISLPQGLASALLFTYHSVPVNTHKTCLFISFGSLHNYHQLSVLFKIAKDFPSLIHFYFSSQYSLPSACYRLFIGSSRAEIFHLSFFKTSTELYDPVCQGRFSVVYVGNNAKVSNFITIIRQVKFLRLVDF